MPELSKVITCTCPSNMNWSHTFVSATKREHRVSFSSHGGYHCTCEGYKYRKKCKHIDESHGLRCGWGADAFANEIHDEKVCPECGEKTVPFYVGV